MLCKIKDNEPLHIDPVRNELRCIENSEAFFRRNIVVGNLPGNAYPTVQVHERNHAVDHFITDIVEQDVDTVWKFRSDGCA